MKTIYISGAITGLQPEEYLNRFADAANQFKAKGWQVINPCELTHCENATWADYMLTDIKALFSCHAIYMLDNWQQSKGARIEHFIAKEMDKEVYYQ